MSNLVSHVALWAPHLRPPQHVTLFVTLVRLLAGACPSIFVYLVGWLGHAPACLLPWFDVGWLGRGPASFFAWLDGWPFSLKICAQSVCFVLVLHQPDLFVPPAPLATGTCDVAEEGRAADIAAER